MKCTKCNKEIENGAKFCTFCGAKKEEIKEEKPTDAPVITVVDAPSHTSNSTYKVYCIDYTLAPDTNYFEATIKIED